MKMEGTLNTQEVGQLFVMQYYTQMHSDASQMHRFYLNDSSFVFGGPEIGSEQPVIGQKAIHDKIVGLGLSQVHTKVKQVDGYTTLSNQHGPGIVVQVTGELSVAGNQMRPFVQTFVLALQSPKKYYIHNDIFRYQLFDEDLCSDSEINEAPTEVTDPLTEVKELVKSPALPEEAHYLQEQHLLPSPATALEQGTISPVPSPARPDQPPPVPTTQSWPEQFQQDAADGIQTNGLPEEHHEPPMEDPGFPVEEEVVETAAPETYPPAAPAVVDERPKTWASRLSQGIPSGGGKVVVVPQAPSPPASKPSNTSSSNQPLPQREPRQRRNQQDRPPAERKQTFGGRGLPDSYQIFVGGLPPNTTEDELKSVFVNYGPILEIRTNVKNFGFIVFDNEESVRQIMQQKEIEPFKIRGKALNIEEKKPSDKRGGGAGMSGGPPSGGRRQVSASSNTAGSNRGASKGGKPPPRRN